MSDDFEKLEGDVLTVEQLVEYLPDLKEVVLSKDAAMAKEPEKIPEPKALGPFARDPQDPSKYKIGPSYKDGISEAAALRKYRRGDVICQEGDFGSSAFYIVSGKVQISIRAPMAHVRTSSSGGLFAKMKSFLVRDDDGKARDSESKQFIPVDANIDLSRQKPIAELVAGDLFGEMTCRTFQPRSATVIAEDDCVMIEMLRSVLDMLTGTREGMSVVKPGGKTLKVQVFKGSPTFRKKMDEKYRARSLANHLRHVPILARLDDATMEQLRTEAELVSFGPGDVVVNEGDAADAFYLIRTGMVKVSSAMPGGELVRTYLSRGDYFGEIGLVQPEGKRTATVRSLDVVECVRIKATTFAPILESFPAIRAEVKKVADSRAAQQKTRSVPAGMNLGEYLDQGLYEAQNLLLINLEKCTRCDACVHACAEAHDGVTRLLRDGLRYDRYLVATACRSCHDPLCMTQCPVGSIRRKDSLEIIIEDWCIGCSRCAELCPYGNINMQPVEGGKSEKMAPPPKPAEGAAPAKKVEPPKKLKATTCDLCTDLSMPSCVYACPHDAAMRVTPANFFAGKSSAQDRQERSFLSRLFFSDGPDNRTTH